MTETLRFNLSKESPQQILGLVREQNFAGTDRDSNLDIELTDALGQDFIGSGLRDVSIVRVIGNLGDFAFCSFGDGQAEVAGDAGAYLGHSFHSGILVLQGNAKDNVGAIACGGTIAVLGNAGARLGIGMQGADLVVRGSVGNQAGLGMREGMIVVGGNAGKDLGLRMAGGTIYLRGDAESISDDIEEHRMREPDRLKIGLLMLKAGIKASGKEFRVYRSIHSRT